MVGNAGANERVSVKRQRSRRVEGVMVDVEEMEIWVCDIFTGDVDDGGTR
jgi:hypothetical protein